MIPWFYWSEISLGLISFQVWGLFAAIGALTAFYFLQKKASDFGLEKQKIFDFGFGALVAGFVGARLVHVFLYEPIFYSSHPWQILAFHQGGFSSFGGIFGGALFVFWRLRREGIRGDGVLRRAYLEMLSVAFLIALFFGRIGCFFIHDHPGRECPGCILTLPFPDGKDRFDLALLELILLLPIVIWVLCRLRAGMKSGFAAMLAICYGLIRFVLDFLRSTPEVVGGDVRYIGLTPGQYFAIFLVVAGVYFLRQNKKIKYDKIQ